MNVTDPMVASVASGTTVLARAPGQTKVVADFGGQKAEAILNVTPGDPSQVAIVDRGIISSDPGLGGVVIGQCLIRPAGRVVGLSFEPPFYRAGVQAMPQTAKLLRQYENGGFDDVSNDANVKIADPKPDVVKVEKVAGGWKVSPVAPGMTKMSATLDGQTASMAIEFMGDAAPGGAIAGELKVDPSTVLEPLVGRDKANQRRIDPGGGQLPCRSPSQSKPPTARASSVSRAARSPAARSAIRP